MIYFSKDYQFAAKLRYDENFVHGEWLIYEVISAVKWQLILQIPVVEDSYVVDCYFNGQCVYLHTDDGCYSCWNTHTRRKEKDVYLSEESFYLVEEDQFLSLSDVRKTIVSNNDLKLSSSVESIEVQNTGKSALLNTTDGRSYVVNRDRKKASQMYEFETPQFGCSLLEERSLLGVVVSLTRVGFVILNDSYKEVRSVDLVASVGQPMSVTAVKDFQGMSYFIAESDEGWHVFKLENERCVQCFESEYRLCFYKGLYVLKSGVEVLDMQGNCVGLIHIER